MSTTSIPPPPPRTPSFLNPRLELRTGYEPGVIGRLGELHGRYYATAWGSGAAFEIMMIRDACDFIEGYDSERDLLVTTHLDGRMIGSLAVLGRAFAADEAQVRFVIVDPAAQGLGAGKAMLGAALESSRRRAIRKLFLWTVEGLPASRRLYESVGFRVVERVHDTRYSVPHEHLRMERLEPTA